MSPVEMGVVVDLQQDFCLLTPTSGLRLPCSMVNAERVYYYTNLGLWFTRDHKISSVWLKGSSATT